MLNVTGFKALFNFVLGFILSASALTADAANLTRAESDTLVQQLLDQDLESFDAFLSQVSALKPALTDIINTYQSSQTMTAEQQAELFRLLGIYTRVQYADEARAVLSELVAIPTFLDESVAQYNNPAFHQIAVRLEVLATEFGLNFRNVDNRVYEITLPGAEADDEPGANNQPNAGEEIVAFHAHADVVPANAADWILEDGTQLDPFTLTEIDGRLYGRGAEDNKNGIVAVMFAMRVMVEEKLPVQRTLRLLVDTTEETTGEAMPYYLERNPMPDFNIALDGGYPVIIAEKGYGTLLARFPFRAAIGEGAELIHLTGGLAGNQIPGAATATLLVADPVEAAARLQQLGANYVMLNGYDFDITTTALADRVEVRVIGTSAHSSEPWTGVNPVARLLDFLYESGHVVYMKDNHLTDAILYAVSNFGLDYTGRQLGINFSDDFMGPLTASLTYVNVDNTGMELITNLRVPRGRDINDLKQDILNRLNEWTVLSNLTLDLELDIAEPMFRNPEGQWIQTLLDVATENLNLPREFMSSDGATSIHDLPNGVQFGLAMPGIKYTGHNDNEFKTIEQFDVDLQIVTEMMARIGSLEVM
ncbi:MAG: dipeptidase [Gammaproteobacteria bacterium]|nr:dipeptidase [Gammaproteobacteria bacterium]